MPAVLAAALACAACTTSRRAFDPPAGVPATAPAPAEGAAPVIHVVQPGENLYRIALAHGVELSELARVNGIADPARIEVGRRLVVPGRFVEEGAPAPPAPAPSPPAAGAWAWPVDGPVYSRFGSRGEGGWHTGIDITVPDGTDVRAARDGSVTFAGRQGRYGILVILEHGDGTTTWYAHLRAARARVGRTVRRGDIVGTTGRTGNSTGPHLHFEIRSEGKPVDPLPFLAGQEDANRASQGP